MRTVGPVRRLLWIATGLLAVGVGTVGIVVPGLPSTVFFIGAAACFARSSPRLEAWLLSRGAIGPLIRDYRAGLGMPRRAKVVAIAMLVVGVSLSAAVLGSLPARLALAAAAAVGVLAILRVPTHRGAPAGPVGDEVAAPAPLPHRAGGPAIVRTRTPDG